MFALSKIVFLTIHNCNEFDPQHETHFIKGHNKCDCFQCSSLRGVSLYFTKYEWLSCLSQTRRQRKHCWNGDRQISHRWLTEEMADLSSVYCLVSKLILNFEAFFKAFTKQRTEFWYSISLVALFHFFCLSRGTLRLKMIFF